MMPMRSISVCFNTSLVRLARGAAHAGTGASSGFQYQLGSIGAHPGCQFARPNHVVSIPAWFDWRPHRWQSARIPHRRFNTSLVRLAPRLQEEFDVVVSKFQYQLGSIGAGTSAPPPGPWRSVSIPAWFDWRGLGTMGQPMPISVSIPAWFDWRPILKSVYPSIKAGFQYQLGSIGAGTP